MFRRGRLNAPGHRRRPVPMVAGRVQVHVLDAIGQPDGSDRQVGKHFTDLLKYVEGDYNNVETFKTMRSVLGSSKQPLFYLAIPPSVFPTVVESLGKLDCSATPWVVEKPFGRDLASARQLNRTLHKVFPRRLDIPDRSLSRQGAGANPALFPVCQCISGAALEFVITCTVCKSQWRRALVSDLAGVSTKRSARYATSFKTTFYRSLPSWRWNVLSTAEAPIFVMRRSKLFNSIRPLQPSELVRGQYRGYRNEPGVAAQFRR